MKRLLPGCSRVRIAFVIEFLHTQQCCSSHQECIWEACRDDTVTFMAEVWEIDADEGARGLTCVTVSLD
jgi:hypothetical protein